MTVVTRSRRDAIARLTRWVVILAASSAVIAVGLLTRSWQTGLSGIDGPVPAAEEPVTAPPVATEPALPVASGPDIATGPTSRTLLSSLDDLRARALTLPVEGTRPEQLVASFDDGRGERRHEAIDILAPIGTPVVAVESGRIEKLFVSDRGGLTIYQFDPLRRYAYYYAHLSRYADGLREGQEISQGQVIGHVGVSGNAPADTPHLHFAIFQLGPEQQWWKGVPIDPYLVWRRDAE
jgi:murein DD-endopeptidase MepM/ murein hydrolase activator NlpD